MVLLLTINGGAWRKDLSKERANFEINLARLKDEQRQAVENLQRVAAAHHEQERKRIQLEEFDSQFRESWCIFFRLSSKPNT